MCSAARRRHGGWTDRDVCFSRRPYVLRGEAAARRMGKHGRHRTEELPEIRELLELPEIRERYGINGRFGRKGKYI
jgi:hypothetical protein